jgi:hypothetical protein
MNGNRLVRSSHLLRPRAFPASAKTKRPLKVQVAEAFWLEKKPLQRSTASLLPFRDVTHITLTAGERG